MKKLNKRSIAGISFFVSGLLMYFLLNIETRVILLIQAIASVVIVIIFSRGEKAKSKYKTSKKLNHGKKNGLFKHN